MSPDQLQSCDSLWDSLPFMNHLSCDSVVLWHQPEPLAITLTSWWGHLCLARLQWCPSHAALHYLTHGNAVLHACAKWGTWYQHDHWWFTSKFQFSLAFPLANGMGNTSLLLQCSFWSLLFQFPTVLTCNTLNWAFCLWTLASQSYPGVSCQKSLWLQAELENKHQPGQSYY